MRFSLSGNIAWSIVFSINRTVIINYYDDDDDDDDGSHRETGTPLARALNETGACKNT